MPDQPNGVVDEAMLPITRDERDVLRRELQWYEGSLGDTVQSLRLGRDDPVLRWRVHILFSLLDDLGWQREDARDEFYVTLPRDEFANWLRRTRSDTEAYAREERRALLEVAKDARDEQRMLVAAGRPSPPVEQLEREWREQATGNLDEALDLMHVCTALLRRFYEES